MDSMLIAHLFLIQPRLPLAPRPDNLCRRKSGFGQERSQMALPGFGSGVQRAASNEARHVGAWPAVPLGLMI